jgi:hypothetical protein
MGRLRRGPSEAGFALHGPTSGTTRMRVGENGAASPREWDDTEVIPPVVEWGADAPGCVRALMRCAALTKPARQRIRERGEDECLAWEGTQAARVAARETAEGKPAGRDNRTK